MSETARILLLGGYGSYGRIIAANLAQEDRIDLIIAGRSAEKAQALAATLAFEGTPPRGLGLDVFGALDEALSTVKPDLVIHTVGPFQGQDYQVAQACVDAGVHYLDLADARGFVAGFSALDVRAKAAGVSLISGASSVPCLTATVVDRALPHFAQLKTMHYGISAAQKTVRGVATTSAILSYLGKPFEVLENGRPQTVYGWQDLHTVAYPDIGRRAFGNCDVPDLALFPARYPTLKTQRFAAGSEQRMVHLCTWALSWLPRAGLLKDLARFTRPLLTLAKLFDPFGSDTSGFHMILTGMDHDGAAIEYKLFLIARQGHGPHIPCVPATVLAKRFARGDRPAAGARACLDFLTFDDYMGALEELDISVAEDGPYPRS